MLQYSSSNIVTVCLCDDLAILSNTGGIASS